MKIFTFRSFLKRLKQGTKTEGYQRIVEILLEGIPIKSSDDEISKLI
jgi:hypothetical protein